MRLEDLAGAEPLNDERAVAVLAAVAECGSPVAEWQVYQDAVYLSVDVERRADLPAALAVHAPNGQIAVDMIGIDQSRQAELPPLCLIGLPTVGDTLPLVLLLPWPREAELIEAMIRLGIVVLTFRRGTETITPDPQQGGIVRLQLHQVDIDFLRNTAAAFARSHPLGRPPGYAEALATRTRLLSWLEAGGLLAQVGGRDEELVARSVRAMQVAWGTGDLYYCAGEPADLIERAAQALPETTIDAKLLPAAAGYWFFARPVRLNYPGEAERLLYGFSWCAVDGREQPCEPDGADVILLNFAAWDRQYTGWVHQPCAWMEVSIGISTTSPKIRGAHKEERTVARLRALASAFLFIQQRILVADAGVLPRPERRRLGREQATVRVDGLRVIVLRHQSQRHPEAAVTGREWQHRWLVSGHWRQQFYPSTQVRRPKWIQAYLKGPEDKPLLDPAKTVFAVLR